MTKYEPAAIFRASLGRTVPSVTVAEESGDEDTADPSESTVDNEVTEGAEGEDVKSGWADSMARILSSNKPKHKKTLILSRAKKDFEIRSKVDSNGTTPVVAVDEDEEEEDSGKPVSKKPKHDHEETVISVKAQRKLELEQRRKLKEWENLNRLKPQPALPTEKHRERELVKLATNGVVQLFNAVNLQQKAIKEKLRSAQKSEFKKDKVLGDSRGIFDAAMEKSKKLGRGSESDDEDDDDEDYDDIKEEGDEDSDGPMTTGTVTFATSNKSTPSQITSNKKKPPTTNGRKSSKKPGFPALHDDFMMGAKLKDWGKEDEESD